MGINNKSNARGGIRTSAAINVMAEKTTFEFAPGQPIKSIFFDLDDTLIACQDKYDVCSRNCLDIFQREFKLNDVERDDNFKYFRTTDLANMAALKGNFLIQRYANSWMQVYREYCDKKNVPVSSNLEQKIGRTASAAWEPPFRVYDGVADTLRHIGREYPEVKINLLSLGDPNVQMTKMNALPEDVRNLFDEIHIVPDKNERIMSELFGSSPEQVLMVGNSEKSDINPALEVGAKAVLIPNNTWVAMKEDVDVSHPSFKTVPTFVKLLQLNG